MERMFDGFGIEMDKEITMDIVKFLTKKGVLRHNCRVRYHIDIGSNFSTDGDDLVRQLLDAAGSADVIIPGKATYRYAPEIKRLTITVLD